MLNRRWVLIPLLLAFAACSGSDRASLAFRIAEDHAGPGLTEMTLEPGGESLYLHDEVVLTQADVDSAAAVRNGNGDRGGDGWSVAVVFKPEGTRKLAEVTANNVGKRCAIVLNGQLVSAPRIQDPIMMGRAVIYGNFAEAEARRIARELSRR